MATLKKNPQFFALLSQFSFGIVAAILPNITREGFIEQTFLDLCSRNQTLKKMFLDGAMDGVDSDTTESKSVKDLSQQIASWQMLQAGLQSTLMVELSEIYKGSYKDSVLRLLNDRLILATKDVSRINESDFKKSILS